MLFWRKFSIVLLVLFSLAFSCFWVQTTYASNLQPNAPCQENSWNNTISIIHVNIQTQAYSYCGQGSAETFANVENCDSKSHDAEADVWQTQVPHAGGTRYNETV